MENKYRRLEHIDSCDRRFRENRGWHCPHKKLPKKQNLAEGVKAQWRQMAELSLCSQLHMIFRKAQWVRKIDFQDATSRAVAAAVDPLVKSIINEQAKLISKQVAGGGFGRVLAWSCCSMEVHSCWEYLLVAKIFCSLSKVYFQLLPKQTWALCRPQQPKCKAKNHSSDMWNLQMS